MSGNKLFITSDGKFRDKETQRAFSVAQGSYELDFPAPI